MAQVTAQLVKELRDKTLAGMTDCKKALDAADGDIDKAVVILRERGLASAAKKTDRKAVEGVVSAFTVSYGQGYIFEVNCETDFVTRSDNFQAFVKHLKETIEHNGHNSLDALLESTLHGTDSVIKDATAHLAATLGENIRVRRFNNMGRGGKTYVGSYVHGEGKMGVLVELEGQGITEHFKNPVIEELTKDVALQVAAMKPLYLKEADIPAEVLRSEEEIIRNKFIAQGKPEAALAKIIPSSMKSWFKEVCLNDQLFVKDETKTIGSYVAEVGKKVGINDLRIAQFVRLELGQEAN